MYVLDFTEMVYDFNRNKCAVIKMEKSPYFILSDLIIIKNKRVKDIKYVILA